MKLSKLAVHATAFVALAAGSVSVMAEPLGIYGAPIDINNNPACINYGDAVSCSAPLLNYFAGLDVSTKTTAGGYVLPTAQGGLKPYIVLGAGGAAALDNADTVPVAGAVENGFKSNAGSDSYFATGQTSTVGGNAGDPANNGLMAGADLAGTWDVGLQWLADALTVGGTRRDLMIGFDYNQPQSSLTSLDFWALITLRDLQGNLSDVNFEILNSPGSHWSTFGTLKTRDSKPSSTDFATVNGVTCIKTDAGGLPIEIVPQPGGSCPAGFQVTVDNAQSTADTEIFAFLPELNNGLEQYILDGYEVASVRMAFGCYQEIDPQGNFNPGTGYLANESTGGKTVNCESGGFGDVYLLAAGERGENVPEPGTLALVGLALGLLGLRARRQAAK